ncbi:hypothetical protein [Shimia abyssi]|uniref:Putative ATP-grasp superfamily ATP-dependent carboligase n=1 Tax=Shimia abyssi TaxID=1662395 RepID=A0A2P8F9S9_9RHOB|nr:hypothetical protein [Shimia abyssi]PSL18458.1 putative ATP-grasp superfamily ATP-dependent carboligase [Shimia abyssi]
MNTSTPILFLGGEMNALAIARHLGPLGVPIKASGNSGCWVMNSRYCQQSFPVPEGTETHAHWRALLLGADTHGLEGHILFALNDDSIEFVLDNYDALKDRFILERFDPDLKRAVLNKQDTLDLANQVGVPAPLYWPVSNMEDVRQAVPDVTFPVMIKPMHSHHFVETFGKKLFIIEDSPDELLEKAQLAFDHDLDIMIVEMIPGDDNMATSCYTYYGEHGKPLIHFTKTIIRRLPKNMGGAVFHNTEWHEETDRVGHQFISGIGWRGIAELEFKIDARDGKLKIIELNSRFTAPHRLLIKVGAKTDLIVYCDLTGQPIPKLENFDYGLRCWYPIRDFRAYLELRKKGELTLWQWLGSVFEKRWILPSFSWVDPVPELIRLGQTLRNGFRRLGRLN